MFYFVKTPWILKKVYAGCTWNLPTTEKVLYLTFDDGPHAQATPFALDELKKYNAKATFFCIGKNVIEEPILYKRILEEGHRTGNHTHNHINGWKTDDKIYFQNVVEAARYIDSNLFRPPYGRISRFQLSAMMSKPLNFKIIMWDVLSADFDKNISAEKCATNVISNISNGSIIIFHDSAKAFDRMSKALPLVLKFFIEKGYRFDVIR